VSRLPEPYGGIAAEAPPVPSASPALPAPPAAAAPDADARRDRRRRRWLLAAIAFLLLWTWPHLGALNNPNEHVRLFMTAALVEHGTFAIGYRVPADGGAGAKGFRDEGSMHARWGYVNDRALVCDAPGEQGPDCAGTLYAGKAPGTSYLGVPFYAATWLVHRALGQEPTKATALGVLRVFTSILPVLWLLWGMARHLDRRVRSPYVRGAVLLGLGLGSLVFSYATQFAGHALSAACLGGGYLLLVELDASRRPLLRAAAAGLLVASAVVAEYPSAIGALLVSGWLLTREAPRGRAGWGRLAAYVGGTIPPALLLGWFHTVAFGAPWRTAYATLENAQFVRDIEPGVMGVHLPDLAAFWGSFFAPFNGLFVFAPWLLLVLPALAAAARWRTGSPWIAAALVAAGAATLAASFVTGWALLGIPALLAAVIVLRRGPGGPPGLGLALAMFLAYGLFITSHSLWRGGWTVGPRYITMMIPFAALAVAYAADRWAERWPRLVPTALGGLVLASVVVVVATGQVSQGFPPEGPYFTFESRTAPLQAIETMSSGTGFVNPLFEFTWPMLRDGWVFPNAGNLLGLRGLVTLLPVAAVALALSVWLTAGRRLPRLAGRAVPVAPAPLATLAVALATLAALALSSWRPPTDEKTDGLLWQRSVWDLREQGTDARERARLEARRKAGDLDDVDGAALIRYLTLTKDDRAAARVLTDGRRGR
jgi:hypothetical protein